MNQHIFVSKKEKRLQLIKNKSVVLGFKVTLGKRPGKKLKEGDLKTPEGEYKIVVKNPKSKYNLSLGLNYPNIDDAIEARGQGIINEKIKDKIISAQKRYNQDATTIIPWDTEMGGKIYIHGKNNNHNNSTKGCIVLDDQDMEKLFKQVKVGTKVFIK